MSPMIVAELAASHCGSMKTALDLVDAAHTAGADAVKTQCWERMTVSEAPLESGPWKGRSLKALYEECAMPRDWHAPIFSRAKKLGMGAFSTPFDTPSVAFLETLDCPIYKIASFEITDLDLIRCAAKTGKPLIISTGMAEWGEIQEAVQAAREAGAGGVTLLKCVSAYPAQPEDYNLRTMTSMRQNIGAAIGLSDHTIGPEMAMAATALGASVIEKHIQLDAKGSADEGFASTPEQFAAMVRGVRTVAAAMGKVTYGPQPSEAPSLALRRSIWATADIKAGEALTRDNIAVLRPQGGLPPKDFFRVLGAICTRDLEAGQPLTEGCVNGR